MAHGMLQLPLEPGQPQKKEKPIDYVNPSARSEFVNAGV
jgi:hypothetical protein